MCPRARRISFLLGGFCQVAPGNLVRLEGSPALTGLDMVDTIPAYDGPNPSSCSVFSG